jgi:hypothetical protein
MEPKDKPSPAHELVAKSGEALKNAEDAMRRADALSARTRELIAELYAIQLQLDALDKSRNATGEKPADQSGG